MSTIPVFFWAFSFYGSTVADFSRYCSKKKSCFWVSLVQQKFQCAIMEACLGNIFYSFTSKLVLVEDLFVLLVRHLGVMFSIYQFSYENEKLIFIFLESEKSLVVIIEKDIMKKKKKKFNIIICIW
jgi:hypothetical protein